MRMLLDLVLPRTDDPSLGRFLRRRLGDEFVDKIADPLFGGIYNAPVDRLSLSATMPRLRERRSVLGFFKGAGALLAPRDGMGALVDALRVPEVEYRTGVRASLDDIDADHIVLAAPPRSVGVACDIASTSVTTVSLGFAGVTLPPGAGFVSPGRAITACSWSSQKFEGRAPEGHALVRCFFRGDGTVEQARRELRDILGITAEPVLARRHHWPDAGHIYEVGHERRVAEVESRLPKRVLLTGSAARGVGIPNLIRDARRVAEMLA
jgi:oxygen-dependent protoporphyrinogen oxidase